MSEILFLEPIFKEMIWGGNLLAKEFGYKIPTQKTGECWAISAHPNGDCTVKTNKYKGMKLSELWNSHRELFGNIQGDEFPLLVKIIDAKDDLSIQVHPDDEYAKKYENGSLGKTECWYILDCDNDAELVLGHNAKNKTELEEMVRGGRWEELIRIKKIKKGDFFQINPGTVHAIKGGTLILETQQNSDITYRLYDYERLLDGKLRELHLDKSIDVVECPHVDIVASKKRTKGENYHNEELYQCGYYKINKICINGRKEYVHADPFTIISVIEGHGLIEGIKIKKGDHFIIPATCDSYVLDGVMELITSTVGNKRIGEK